MTDYNIEIEIFPEMGYMTIDSPSGHYEYDINSVQGGEIIAKTIGSDAPTTVYAQNRTFNSIEDYSEYASRRDEEVY